MEYILVEIACCQVLHSMRERCPGDHAEIVVAILFNCMCVGVGVGVGVFTSANKLSGRNSIHVSTGCWLEDLLYGDAWNKLCRTTKVRWKTILT